MDGGGVITTGIQAFRSIKTYFSFKQGNAKKASFPQTTLGIKPFKINLLPETNCDSVLPSGSVDLSTIEGN